MYRPNFCSECGTGIARAKWRLWTNRQFCASCAGRFGKRRVVLLLAGGLTVLAGGFVVGRYQRPSSPPLIIHRSAWSPLVDAPLALSAGPPAALLNGARGSNPQATAASSQMAGVEEAIYTCGARTRKGTPCSRRVHAPVRCWQHKGVPAMVPQEKLLARE